MHFCQHRTLFRNRMKCILVPCDDKASIVDGRLRCARPSQTHRQLGCSSFKSDSLSNIPSSSNLGSNIRSPERRMCPGKMAFEVSRLEQMASLGCSDWLDSCRTVLFAREVRIYLYDLQELRVFLGERYFCRSLG